METAEYENLDRVEREHWYYAGKREIVEHWIQRCRPLRPSDTLLDFGAGTGLFASAFKDRCRVLCYDSYPQSQQILKTRFPAESVLDASGPGIPVPDGSVDCLTALDVLEHLEDDRAAVREFHRVLSPSGLLVVTVPADMKLWSDWDVALYHYRRYDREGLRQRFDPAQWEIIQLSYKNIFAYPAIYLLRKWRKWTKTAPGQGRRAEDQVPPRPLNALLRLLYTVPAKTGWCSAPFGVSLLLVARKR